LTAEQNAAEKEASDAAKAEQKIKKDREKELKDLKRKISKLQNQNVRSFHMPLAIECLMCHNVNVGCQEKLEKSVHNTTRVIKRVRESAEIPVPAPSPVIIMHSR
jgi:hypothetical protein